MAVIRGRRVAARFASCASFASMALLATPDARAADGVLPHGVHLGRNGRYVQDITDHSAKRHAMAARLLPEDYTPSDAVPEAQQAFCAQASAHPGTTTSPPAGSLGTAEILEAYKLPTTTGGAGRIVAIVDMPDTTAFADLTVYRAAYGLPALPQCAGGLPDGKTPCFAAVDQDGNANPSVTDCVGADPEVSLDMDMVSAACEDCSILLVQMTKADTINGPEDQDFLDSVAVAAKLGARATSISFGGPEKVGGSDDPTGYTTSGHLVVAASGDSGYLLEGEVAGVKGVSPSPSYPGSSPDVLGVGGTLLQQTTGGFVETVWNDVSGAGGSGCSIQYSMPAFQTAFGSKSFGTCAMRDSVDLAAAADFLPTNATRTQGGITEYDAYNKWVQVVGTSASAPMMAAILVRLGVSDAISRDFGFVYRNLAAFNDVTSGSNDGFDNQKLCDTAHALQCTAGVGWDGPTGVGTPDGTKLVALDAGVSDDDTTVSAGGSSGCGCSAPGSEAPSARLGAWLALAVLAGAGARRKRR